MIEARLAKTAEELEAVKKAMPIFGKQNSLIMYGYWEEDNCIGGVFLQQDFPNELVMELYSHSPSLVKAIGYSFEKFLEVKSTLTARISKDNNKSIKIAKSLGWTKLYVEDNQVVFQFNKENWKFNKKYQLT
jgi:hypothetical protein